MYVLNVKSDEDRIFLVSTGCVGASIKLLKLKRYLKLNDYHVVENVQDANVCILSNCIGGQKGEKASYSYMLALFEKNSNVRLIFTGCGPKALPENFKEFESFPDYEDIELKFPPRNIKFSEVNFKGEPELQRKISKKEYSQVYLDNQKYLTLKRVLEKIDFETAKLIFAWGVPPIAGTDLSYRVMISQGCNNRCSYCLIWKGLGPYKSFSKEKIFSQIKEGVNKGFNNFLILCDDAYSYGIDIYKKFALGELFEEIFQKFPQVNFAFRYFSPVAVVKLFKENKLKLFAKHSFFFNIPIQSGSEKILKKMNRPRNLKILKEALLDFKKEFKGSLMTNIICGMPGETLEDVETTIKYLKEAQFDNMIKFKFSPRPRTPLENEKPCENADKHFEILERAKRFIQVRFLERKFRNLIESESTDEIGFKLEVSQIPDQLKQRIKNLKWSEWKNKSKLILSHKDFPDFFLSIGNEIEFFIKNKNIWKSVSAKITEEEKKHLTWFFRPSFEEYKKQETRYKTAKLSQVTVFIEKENQKDFLALRGKTKEVKALLIN